MKVDILGILRGQKRAPQNDKRCGADSTQSYERIPIRFPILFNTSSTLVYWLRVWVAVTIAENPHNA